MALPLFMTAACFLLPNAADLRCRNYSGAASSERSQSNQGRRRARSCVPLSLSLSLSLSLALSLSLFLSLSLSFSLSLPLSLSPLSPSLSLPSLIERERGGAEHVVVCERPQALGRASNFDGPLT